MTKIKYYAIKKGHKTGIFTNWDECSEYVKGFSGAEYKSFKSKEEAEKFLSEDLKPETKPEESNKTIKHISTEDELHIYVDGSFDESKGKYGSGVVIIEPNKIKKVCFNGNQPEYLSMRNVSGEIKAAEYAMRYCIKNNIKTLNLYYDYEGIEKWCTKDWKANKDCTKAYSDFYDKAKNYLNVNFIKVKAHKGNTYNEMADQLAKKAVLS